MTRQEFKDFYQEYFTERGFRKKRNMYFLNGNGVLCGLYLQKSISDAYYINAAYYIGDFPTVKSYPTFYDHDYCRRIAVWSKERGCNGKYFMAALISYELYTAEEIKKYLDKAYENHMIPILSGDKNVLRKEIEDCDYMAEEKKEAALKKLENS